MPYSQLGENKENKRLWKIFSVVIIIALFAALNIAGSWIFVLNYQLVCTSFNIFFSIFKAKKYLLIRDIFIQNETQKQLLKCESPATTPFPETTMYPPGTTYTETYSSSGTPYY